MKTLIEFFKWGKRDNICAAALLLGLIGAVPNILTTLGYFITNALIPLAQALGGNQ